MKTSAQKSNGLLYRSISLILALCVLGTTASAAFPKTSVTDEMLFLQYPQYLNNNDAMEYINRAFDLCFEYFGRQTGKNGAIYATIIDDGTSIGLQEVASKLGWGKDYQESILESATEKFLSAASAGNGEMPSAMAKKADKLFKPLSTLSSFTKALPEGESTKILADMLKAMGIASPDKKAPEMYKAISKSFPSGVKTIKYGVESWKGFLAVAELYCYRYEVVDMLMDEVDTNSDLYIGLKDVKKSMENPGEYIRDHFLRTTFLNEIGGWASKNALAFVADVAGMSKEMKSVVSLCKTLYFKFIYEGYKVNDYAEAVYLLSFAQSIDSKLSNMRIQFMQGKLSSKEDIEKYEALLEAEVYALVSALNVSAKLMGKNYYYENQADDPELLAINLTDTRGYEWCMYAAKKALEDDIKAGKAVKRRDNTSVSSPTNLQIKLDKSKYTLGDTIKITPSAQNASGYLASIWYGAFRTGTKVYTSNTFTGSITFKPDKAGTYTIRIDANHLNGRDKGYISAEKTFTVAEAKSETTTSATNTNISDGTYHIEAYCGKVVEVADSQKGDRANVQIWALSKNNLGCQKFKIKKSGNYYTITAVHSGKALDIADGSSESGTNVWQWHTNDTAAQQWIFEDAGNGYVYIKSALGTYLDVKNNDTANGTNVWAYKFNGSTAQMFKLVSAK